MSGRRISFPAPIKPIQTHPKPHQRPKNAAFAQTPYSPITERTHFPRLVLSPSKEPALSTPKGASTRPNPTKSDRMRRFATSRPFKFAKSKPTPPSAFLPFAPLCLCVHSPLRPAFIVPRSLQRPNASPAGTSPSFGIANFTCFACLSKSPSSRFIIALSLMRFFISYGSAATSNASFQLS